MVEKPPLPESEADRLAALREYQILDTAPEPAFDDLTRLAATICQAPIALVSLVDAERQWFKSNVGFPAPETPRRGAFCAHTILEDQPLVVRDASADGRFGDSPLVTSDPNVRFYAGVPLMTPKGHAVGALCVMDKVPRELSAEQLEALRLLGRQAVAQLELRRHLLHAGERFRDLLEAAPDGIVVVTREGIIELANAQTEQLFGYQRNELLGRPVEILLPPRLREAHEAHRAKYAAEPRTRPMGGQQLLTGRRKDGSELPVEISLSPLDGDRLRVIASVRDVSARQRVLEDLRKVEARLAEAQQMAHLGNWEWNVQQNELWWSDEIYRVFGLAPQEFGATYEAFLGSVHPDDRQIVKDAVNRALYEGEPYQIDHRIVLPDGTERTVHEWADVVLDEAGNPVRMVGTVQDITERKRAEEELRQARNRMQQYLDIAGVMLVALDRNGRITLINKKGCAVLAYEREEELVGRDWFDTCLPASVAGAVRSVFAKTMRDEVEPAEQYDNPVLTRAGTERMIAWHNAVLRDDGGQPAGTLSSGEDITERRLAEDALRRSEANYRDLVEHATYGIYRSNLEGSLLTVNRALVDMLGYESHDDLLGLDLVEDVYAEDSQRAQLVDQYRNAERVDGLEVQWKRKDGTPITVRLSGRPVLDEQGRAESFEMIAEDVTAQRTLEAQLRQAQKMEAVGQLTGGIAHDFNNILTVILSNADLIASALPPDQTDLGADLKELHAAAHRGATLVRKLLGFSRRERLEFRPVDLSKLVTDMSRMLRRVVPESIEIQLRATGALGTVQADPGAVEQILLNLATNARDAMPEGGILRIETEQTWLDQAYHATHPWCEPGEYTCIIVSDTGVGMDRETRERIFEPFYTTKPHGEGTGLGMAMIYGLVKQHAGYVNVYSERGQGTTVRVYLPVVGDDALSVAAGPMTEKMPRGTETILLAEDERAIRRATKRALEAHGYNVLLAEDGEEAIEVFQAHESEIDLVISDLVMPKLGGRQLYDALRQEGTTVPVIFASGYSAREVEESATLKPNVPFLHKPWTLTDLLVRIREVLDREASH